MPKLLAVIDVDEDRIPDYQGAAQDQLCSFREAVLPTMEWGLEISRATEEDMENVVEDPSMPSWFIVREEPEQKRWFTFAVGHREGSWSEEDVLAKTKEAAERKLQSALEGKPFDVSFITCIYEQPIQEE